MCEPYKSGGGGEPLRCISLDEKNNKDLSFIINNYKLIALLSLL